MKGEWTKTLRFNRILWLTLAFLTPNGQNLSLGGEVKILNTTKVCRMDEITTPTTHYWKATGQKKLGDIVLETKDLKVKNPKSRKSAWTACQKYLDSK